eukprot:6223023-Lingulodinium_polyedra.AAC.1
MCIRDRSFGGVPFVCRPARRPVAGLFERALSTALPSMPAGVFAALPFFPGPSAGAPFATGRSPSKSC